MKLPKNPHIIISRGDVLGDTVVTTALIAPLKKVFPNCKISFLVRKDYFPLLENHPDIDNLIADPLPYSSSKDDWPHLFKLAKTLKKLKPDVFIGAWENPRYGLLAFLSRIPIRIGHAFSLSNRIFYTHTISLNYLDYTLHKIDYNGSLLKLLGIQDASSYPVKLYTNRHTNEQVLHTYKLQSKTYVALHIDAGNPQRILPDKHFIDIARFIIEQTLLTVVLFGRQQNSESAKAISNAIQSNRLVNTVPNLNLSETHSLIKQSAFLIGSDSGPVHIASGHEVPVIVYYVNRIQNALHWGPWQTKHRIIKTIHHCIDVCSPTNCRKPDCRETIPLNEFQQAILEFTTPEKPVEDPHLQCDKLPNTDRYYWFKTSIVVGLIGPKNANLYAYLKETGWVIHSWTKNISMKPLKQWMTENNISLLVYTDDYIPYITHFKCELLLRWVSNFIAFLPKLISAKTAFEFEHQVNLLLPNSEDI